ncbi:hypothetical protein [Burkholderia pseudomallei]|uniref:hypothetical protein n=1 Tax=Burkholderia pseudomallei TaxID=28450 RepID=UPI002948CF30|nr:hypothetical protein [Burkholderia pseudomallei]CAJ9472360.1 Uncharacterised protein [Burkholderia pseudomallei]
MALDRYISRLARILVDSEKITFDEAQKRLKALTLEVVVGPDAASPAAHAAVLTAVSVGRRTFVGGVRVVGAMEQPINCALPLGASSLGEAAEKLGAVDFDGAASRTIIVGTAEAPRNCRPVSVWWDKWRAGTSEAGARGCEHNDNPLVGIAAGALGVAWAFEAERGCAELGSEIDLWPTIDGHEGAPRFSEVFLPGALWLIGLGNLGQAFLWALAALPYENPNAVSLVLQDRDKISEENWATSILVDDDSYGLLKTRVAENWALAKGFDVRRIDRMMVTEDRLDYADPRVALCGVDKVESRKQLESVGFDCIVDAGLGRTATDFDRYRISIFDSARSIRAHFAGQGDAKVADEIPEGKAYQDILHEIGRCGAAEIAGASLAAPYVSAVAAAVAIARVIAITSGCTCPSSEVGKLSSLSKRRIAPMVSVDARGARHAGKPNINFEVNDDQ